jgi:hypothetical protein
VGFFVYEVELGQVFSKYFGFVCHLFIPAISPLSSLSVIRGWYSRPITGLSNSGVVSTPAKSERGNKPIVVRF